MGDLHRSIFLKELKDTFPDLISEINAQYGLLHQEMHVFADFVQRAIAVGHAKDVASCFEFAEKFYRDGNDQLQNAIGVSFIEHLSLQNAQWAWDLLGPS
ncbi:hypothetical protein CV770_01680 [Bradyrhizobium sp. AC87j1]|uniref:DUF7674 family protein n=1 Tax=Bradyrhizobium sp. AC87j1 TaxID=2055894 RepID=UPI000CECBB55|nr:hypothetical protein [Bradyrhizobium sp. AC87j1]PPQ20979.1 hypothetical protein CV770_01680 [Bradyrhizobium sp. AC87j1]